MSRRASGRKWIGAALLAAGMAGSLPAQEETAPPPQSSTTRDEYLEAWFAETVTGDFEEALRHYRRAIDAATDPELVARAWWRTAEIAAARGETELARQLLVQVEEQFPDSPAAALARESLQTLGAPERSASETAQIEEARQLLREILLDRPDPLPLPRLQVIFQRLSAAQILEECEWLGVDLHEALDQASRQLAPYGDTLAGLVVAARGPLARSALNCLDPHSMATTPESLVALRDRPDLQPDLLVFLARRGDDAALDAAVALAAQPEVRRSVLTPDAVREIVLPLAHNESPQARDVLETLFAELVEKGQAGKLVDLLSYRHCATALQSATPAAAWLREQFPAFTPAQRYGIVQELNPRLRVSSERITFPAPLPAELVQTLARDPEPLVRAQGVLRRIASKSPEDRAQGLALLATLEPGAQAALISAAVGQTDPPYSLDELLDLPVPWAPSLVYFLALGGGSPRHQVPPALALPGRSRADVLAHGLAREDPGLVEAVFGDWLGSFNARLPPGQGVSDNPSVRELLKGELQEGHRPDYPALLARLVLQGARSESSAVRVSSVSFAYELGSGVPGLDDLPAQAARDPVPQVRWVAVASLPWQAFPRDAQIALLTDASLAIQRSAFQKCQDPEVLVEALEHLPPARQEELFLRLEFPLRKHPAVLRRLWSTVPAASPLAAFCFEELKGQDVDVLLEGVTHPQATVSDEAVQILKDLPYPEDLRSQLFNSGVGTRAGLQARLREHRDEVADALRRAEIQRALAEVHTSEKVPPEIGERLAALGARDELREMVLSNDQAVVLAGAGGLATLGDGDGLRRALQSTPYPELLFADAIRAGLLEDVLAVASAAPRDLGNALRKAGRPELLADVFQRRPDLARTWQGDAGTVDTLLDTLAGRNDPDLLLQAVDLYDSPRAASLLVTGGHYPQVFEHLPHWRNEAQKAAVESLRQLTGIPAQPTQPTQAPWPQFRADQEALVQAWQTALRSAGDR